MHQNPVWVVKVDCFLSKREISIVILSKSHYVLFYLSVSIQQLPVEGREGLVDPQRLRPC
jgi:hypothetical protein